MTKLILFPIIKIQRSSWIDINLLRFRKWIIVKWSNKEIAILFIKILNECQNSLKNHVCNIIHIPLCMLAEWCNNNSSNPKMIILQTIFFSNYHFGFNLNKNCFCQQKRVLADWYPPTLNLFISNGWCKLWSGV